MTAVPSRAPLLAAGLIGLTGIALGAFGAHALKATLVERGMSVVWESAVKYHLLHAIALLALAAWARADTAGTSARLTLWVTRCWIGGVGLFSGSLYWLALGGPRWLGPVTPLGGVAFMAGWLLLALAALRQKG
ncbi:MAG: DUF423 domain-containing protein [Opitutaceae bacterium]|nr:DUF423 domain-containing protein [Opitutaceae bacterium]